MMGSSHAYDVSTASVPAKKVKKKKGGGVYMLVLRCGVACCCYGECTCWYWGSMLLLW